MFRPADRDSRRSSIVSLVEETRPGFLRLHVALGLGSLQSSGLESLTSHGFELAKQALMERLLNFQGSCDPAGKTRADVLELHAELESWAGFACGDADTVGILEAVTHKKRKPVGLAASARMRKRSPKRKTRQPLSLSLES